MPGREDWKAPDAKKDAQGISPAARDVGGNVDIQREAWETMLRGNPDLARQLEAEGKTGFKPWDAPERQRIFDAIDAGVGGRSDGRGQVYSGPGDPPPYQAPPKPVPKRFKGSDAGGAATFAAASAASHAGHSAAPTVTGSVLLRGFQNPNNLRAALVAQGKRSDKVKG